MEIIYVEIIATILLFMVGNYFWQKRKEYNHIKDSLNNELSEWLKNEEPKYRFLHTYPPDWDIRKKYVQKLNNYKCQICGFTHFHSEKDLRVALDTRRHTLWTGLHVHHKLPLSKGGDNDIANLICLCERCHENQHPHMLQMKIDKLNAKISRARSPSIKAGYNREIADLKNRLEYSKKNSTLVNKENSL